MVDSCGSLPNGDQTYAPSDFVVPVVGLNDDGSCGLFLGTGVFVGDKAKLVTCDQVLSAWAGQYGVAIEAEKRLAKANVLVRDVKTDLALPEVLQYRPPHTLPPEEDQNLTLNNLVICFEYGTTMTAGHHISFSPASRLGNVTRFRNLSDIYGEAGDQMLELSFPAMKGASGAPIMEWTPPFKLWGIVKANVSHELLPVQVETIVDEKGQLDEQTKFYLPQALAIHVKHVRRLIL
jgi:hypothetical protein